MASAQELMYVKTNIGGYFFDAFFQTNYTRSLTITSDPVETGAAISDHSFINPVELVFQIGMSDVATSVIPGQFSEGKSRSLAAAQVLGNLQTQRIPVKVMTRLGSFNNMLVETLVIPDDNTTLYGLKATVTMKEIFVATVKTVKISARPQTTDSTNRGTVQPVQPNQSNLYQLEQALLGWLKSLGVK